MRGVQQGVVVVVVVVVGVVVVVVVVAELPGKYPANTRLYCPGSTYRVLPGRLWPGVWPGRVTPHPRPAEAMAAPFRPGKRVFGVDFPAPPAPIIPGSIP